MISRMENIEEDFVLDREDCSRVDSLNQFSTEIERSKPKQSFEIAREAYELAKSLSYGNGIARSLFRMGRSSWLYGNLEQAVNYLHQALEMAKGIENHEYEVETLNTLGNSYIDFQNFDKALECYMGALKIAKQIGYVRMEGVLSNNIGEIYKFLESFESALQYYLESVQIYDSLGDEVGKGIPFLNIGAVYFFVREYENAQYYNHLSLKIFQGANDRIGESYSFHQLAKVYHQIGQHELALAYYLKSLAIFDETGDRFHKIDMLIDLYRILKDREDHEGAIQYLRKALSLAEEIKANNMIAKVCSYFASTYEECKDYEQALFYYKKYHDIEREDTNYKLEQKLKSVTTQFKMEQTQQEKEIYRLKNVELKEKTLELERKTQELEESYKSIAIISEIGQSITATLNLEKILDRIYKSVNNLMDATAFGIGLYDDENRTIDYKLFIEDGKKSSSFISGLDNKNSLAAWCIINNKEVFMNHVEEEYHHYIQHTNDYIGQKPQSIIYCPLIVENEVIGVVTVQSKTKNAYTIYDLDMLKAFGIYLAIAIKNARQSEKLALEIEERIEAQSKLKDANQKLLDLSKLDGLTGIPNRRKFEEVIGHEWARSKREGRYLSLVFIDIDHFKEYNDNYGHLAGDICIKLVAQALQDATKRSTDFIGRFGGDEFVAVLPDTNLEGATQVAETMRKVIEELRIDHEYSSASRYVTTTLGIATMIPCEEIIMESLIEAADKALYSAKRRGRNCLAKG